MLHLLLLYRHCKICKFEVLTYLRVCSLCGINDMDLTITFEKNAIL